MKKLQVYLNSEDMKEQEVFLLKSDLARKDAIIARLNDEIAELKRGIRNLSALKEQRFFSNYSL